MHGQIMKVTNKVKWLLLPNAPQRESRIGGSAVVNPTIRINPWKLARAALDESDREI